MGGKSKKASEGDWSPPLFVIEIAKRLLDDPVSFGLKDTPELGDLIARLRCDPRMRAVWRQLMRPKGTKGFYYPARIAALNPYFGSLEYVKARNIRLRGMGADDDARAELKSLRLRAKHSRVLKTVSAAKIARWPANIRQEVACAGFFCNAVQFASWETTVLTMDDMDAAAREIRSIADKLESSSKDASLFLKIEMPSVILWMIERLRKSRTLFEHHESNALVVKRRRSDGRIRAFVIRLNARALVIFGQHFHGQIATISNVIFGDPKLTDARIRQMVRPQAAGRGGGKRANSAS